jgi:hypothetical protein
LQTGDETTQNGKTWVYDSSIPAWVPKPTPMASQAEMEAGTEEAARVVSPLRVAQAIAALAEGGEGAWDGDIADINLDGGTDIGADLADADLLLVDDGGAGTNRKSALSRVWTYISGKLATWTGSSSITTVGTVTTGTWQGTAVGTAYVDATDDGAANPEKVLKTTSVGSLTIGSLTANGTIVSGTASVVGQVTVADGDGHAGDRNAYRQSDLHAAGCERDPRPHSPHGRRAGCANRDANGNGIH